MIGNDIIDLNCAQKESNWRRKGYLEKIYTNPEQKLIKSSADPEIMVWILWSIKEAAYKVNNRLTNIREYAPSKIKCSIGMQENNTYYGIASYNNLEYISKTNVFQDYIHSIALFNSSDFSGVNEIIIKDYPKNYIEFLKKNEYFAASESIQKNEFGIPNLYNEVTKEIKPMSISHHGNYLSLVTT